MLDKISLRKVNIIFLLITFGLIYLIFSCAPAPTKSTKGKITDIVEERLAKIELINVIPGPSDKEATIEITSSKPVSYAAFLVDQPLRLIVDIGALPAKGLPGPAVFNGKIIKAIHLEEIKDRPKSTRLIVTLSRDVEYKVREKDRIIKLLLLSKKPAEKLEKQPLLIAAKKEEEIGPKEPRLFFSPGKTKLNQILGIDFFTLPRGKSRVTVTTSKKAEYELSRKDSLSLILKIKEATIHPTLTRYIDSSQFKGVVNRITPIVKVAERQVNLEIELKEMVPYHLTQADKEIRLDFNKTSVKPPAKKITPARLTKALVNTEEIPNEAITAISPGLPFRYKGARMTLDFANADIRNILKLIGEVSKLNIVWGPEVKGTVSMRLKNVPWDQALSILLETNNLGMRREENIVWVTTKARIAALEKEEQEKLKAEQEKIKAAKEEAKAAREEAKEEEPLITEYLRVDFADADADIKPHIEKIKSERGSISVDKRTNTIIMSDIASIIEKAKNMVKEFDTPVKQIMIEARIVDASTTFSRDLGVQWTNIEGQRRKEGASFGIPTDATLFSAGGDLYGGSFSTNAPSGWSSNIGLSFGVLTSSGLGALTLNAQLALAETEGKVSVISAPKVIASNGETAVISRGDIIYKEIVTADTSGIEELEATLSLIVTPTVSFNNYVTMQVEVTDDKAYADLSGKTEKSIKTKLMVKSGDTVVIGGIFKEDKAETETGIPGLSKIPILGWLFKAKTKSVERTELLIFLTPTVIPTASEKN